MLRIGLDNILNIDINKYNLILCVGDRYNTKTYNISNILIEKDNNQYFLYLKDNLELDEDIINTITLSLNEKKVKEIELTLDIDNGINYIYNSDFVIKARKIDFVDKKFKIFQLLNNLE